MLGTTLVDRALVRLSGDGVRDFLQGLITNDVAPGRALPVWSGLLTAQGKCLFDFLIWEDGDALLIDCERDQRDALMRRLALYRLRRPILIEAEDGLAVHWARDGGDGVPDPRLAALGRRWLAPPGPPAEGWIAHRLSLGVCEGAAELGDLLWLECNAVELNGISFTKGCFVGQENSARMNWRQKVNRRLFVVPCASPGPRTRVRHDGLGLCVDHRRVDDPGDALVPDWLAPALEKSQA